MERIKEEGRTEKKGIKIREREKGGRKEEEHTK